MASGSASDFKQLETSSKAYLEKHSISAYIEVVPISVRKNQLNETNQDSSELCWLRSQKDAICRLLEDRPERPAKFLAEYVNRGTNTLLREFEFVQATPANRTSFVDRFADTLEARTAVSYTAAEYQHLVELICSDFPRDLTARAAEIAAAHGSSALGRDYGVKIDIPVFVECLKSCFLYLGSVYCPLNRSLARLTTGGLEFIELTRRTIKLASAKLPVPHFLEQPPDTIGCQVQTPEERLSLKTAIVEALNAALINVPHR
ncbi:hypothetical protein HDU87_007474 [Geranomyces variabilis]|uniref:Centriolar satellite-associated tubulin polyglutamylase complex regulator 1 n=1 Tax=Geranomyces variabilis TaxID=109894 RepID=A0AAD5XUT9_9FUNG|nr:hypothetical protein HDU87_007474 [Geranomyces variabilis]